MNAALVQEGRAPLSLEAVLPMIGDGARMLVLRALGGEADAAVVDRTAEIFQRCYLEKPCVHTTLLPGARELLALSFPVAVVTNKPHRIARLVLEALGIRHEALWGGGHGPMKPAPDGLLAVARELQIPIERAWMIGDGPQDVLAGKAARCFTVAVPGIADRNHVLEAKPDLVIESLTELLTLV